MTDPSQKSTACLYALKLVVHPGEPQRLAGRLEHVLSGRLHAFADGAALLAALAEEQAQGYRNDDTPLPFSTVPTHLQEEVR